MIIAFDSDVMAKDTVRSALDRLGDFLKSRGAMVQYILMPDLPDGGKCGLDDWFALGGHDNSIAALDALGALAVDALPELAVASPVAGVARPNILQMSDVKAEEVDWLWQGWIPKGMISMLGGYAGDGKSTFIASLVASLSTGAPLPDGSIAPITNCLILPAEDDVAHVVKPRLAIHGADMNRVAAWQTIDTGDGIDRMIDLQKDIPTIARVIRERNIGLMVIDPLSGFTPKADRNSEGEVRDHMQQLIPILEDTRCAVLGVMHMGKNSGHARAFQSLMGSTAFTAIARSVLMLSNLPMTYQVEGEPPRKVVGVAKSNYAESPQPIQFYRPRDQAIEYLGPSPLSLDAALNAKPGGDDGRGPNETEKAEAWLLEQFPNGPRRATDLEAAAKEEGFSRTALYRVKKSLGINSMRREGVSFWGFPDADNMVA